MIKPIDVFTPIRMEPGNPPEFPLDLYWAGPYNRGDAYVIPDFGRMPERIINGDYVLIPNFNISSESKIFEELVEKQHEKINDEAWRLLLAASEGEDEDEVLANTQEELHKWMTEAVKKRFNNAAELTFVNVGDDHVGVMKDEVATLDIYWTQFLVWTIHEENTVFDRQGQSPYCWGNFGFACLDHRRLVKGRIVR